MNNERFASVYYQPGDETVLCFRSGLTVYEEVFSQGVLTSAGWNAAGYPLNVLSNYPTRLSRSRFRDPSAFHLDIDGQSLDHRLKLVDFRQEERDGAVEAILILRSLLRPVEIRVHTLLDGTAILTRWLEIQNLGTEPMRVSRLGILSGGLENMDRSALTLENRPEKLYSLGYFGADCWGREGDFLWQDLQPLGTAVDTRFGRNRFRHPQIFLRNNVTGMHYTCQLGWSGGCRFFVDYTAMAEKPVSALSLSAEITGFTPLFSLQPGEVFTTPEVHVGAVQGDLDTLVQETHRHIRRSVLPLEAPCLVGGGMGAEHDMTPETTKAFARQLAQMGAEVFILDAGWVCPMEFPIDWMGYNGENVPHPDRYPNGLEEIRDYCHSIGIGFGLWVEIERLGGKSSVLQAHPEWVAKDLYGAPAPTLPLDLTHPEAFLWAENELTRIIETYNLDLLRVDHNLNPENFFTFGADCGECLSVRHFQAVYRLYGNLKKRFPKVVFEACASGGGRTDLGLMKHFHHTWVSDWQKAPRSIMITNGMTLALPPERVDRLFAGMGSHPFGSLDLQLRNTMLGHMSLNVIAPADTEPNPQAMAFVQRSVALYKDFIRPMLADALVWHHTPQVGNEDLVALELSNPDKTRAVAGVFALTGTHPEPFRLYPKGLDAGKTYRVTLDNSGTSFPVEGWRLQQEGLRIELPAPLSSELVLFEAI